MLHGIALRYFVEVARTGSLATASEALHVAVSAISRQISKLEQELGAALFERLPRGMVLTEAGELLVEHARRTLLEADAVLSQISSNGKRDGGLVRIACTEGFTRTFLPTVLARHQQAAAMTRYVVRSGSPAHVEHSVAIGEADIGIAYASTPSSLNVIYKAEAPIRALLNPSHPLASRTLITIEDLKHYPLALLERGTTIRDLFDLCCANHGVKIEPALVTNNSALMDTFASLSHAIALGGAASLKGLAKPSLISLPFDEPVLNERVLRVVTMRGRRLSPLIEELIEAILLGLDRD